MNIILKNIFNLIAKYNLHMEIERCGYENGFIITIYRNGISRSHFIDDGKLVVYDEDYWLFIIKKMICELLDEEKRCLKIVEQFKKQNIAIEIS